MTPSAQQVVVHLHPYSYGESSVPTIISWIGMGLMLAAVVIAVVGGYLAHRNPDRFNRKVMHAPFTAAMVGFVIGAIASISIGIYYMTADSEPSSRKVAEVDQAVQGFGYQVEEPTKAYDLDRTSNVIVAISRDGREIPCIASEISGDTVTVSCPPQNAK